MSPERGRRQSHPTLGEPRLRVVQVSAIVFRGGCREGYFTEAAGGIRNGIVIGASARCSLGMACVFHTAFNLYNKSMLVVKQVLFPPLYGGRNQGLEIKSH